jgi:hypothetical protein
MTPSSAGHSSNLRSRVVSKIAGLVAAVSVAGIALPGCTAVQRTGDSPAYLIVDDLEGASGATPGTFGSPLESDTVTVIKQQDASGQTVLVPTILSDPGKATLRLAMKDPGTADSPSRPTDMNTITVTRYHVAYIRADGRNAQGVDVPFAFDGATTMTVTEQGATAGFTLVRFQAKEEAPLASFDASGVVSTIALITFYGTDQAGSAVNVTGQIGVDFSNFADPE